MNLSDTLRSRWKPSYAARLSNGSHAFDTALSFIGAGAIKRAEIAKPGTLSAKGISEAVQAFAAKGIVPELKRFKGQVATERATIKQRRADLGKPKIDPTDAAAASLRQEYRSYLRSLELSERAKLIISGGDPMLIDAALEAPTLSGLSSDLHAKVVDAYIDRTAAPELQALEEAEEALDLVTAAIRSAEMDLAEHVDLPPHEFRSFLDAA